MPKFSISNITIAALWVFFIASAIVGTSQDTPPVPFAEKTSLAMTVILLMLPILMFGAVSFFGLARSPFYHPKLAGFINTRYGDQVLESFLVRLKPYLLFGVVSLLQGAFSLWQTYSSGGPRGAYFLSGFFVSCGLACILAHFILYIRKAVGVFPTWTLDHPLPPAPTKKTLREALRIYWWTLIGIAVFPAVIANNPPFEIFVLPFAGVAFLAAWPILSGRAPYSFWLVACAVWLAGGICAALLAPIIRSFLG